jgi:type II secretion system protein I
MRRTAFTLLEVILALSILVVSMAVLGELVRSGLISAQRARDLSRATLLCEGKLAEVTAMAGTAEPQAISSAPFETEYSDFGQWLYSVEVEQTASTELLAIRVTVMHERPNERNPVSCTLVRYVRAAYDDVPATTTDTSSSSSTGSSSGGMR